VLYTDTDVFIFTDPFPIAHEMARYLEHLSLVRVHKLIDIQNV
jgi:hypothetical protein